MEAFSYLRPLFYPMRIRSPMLFPPVHLYRIHRQNFQMLSPRFPSRGKLNTPITNSIPANTDSTSNIAASGTLITDQAQIERLLGQMNNKMCKFAVSTLSADLNHLVFKIFGQRPDWIYLAQSILQSDPGFIVSLLKNETVLSIFHLYNEKNQVHRDALFENLNTWSDAVRSVFGENVTSLQVTRFSSHNNVRDQFYP